MGRWRAQNTMFAGVNCVDWSSCGNYLFSGSYDMHLDIWDVRNLRRDVMLATEEAVAKGAIAIHKAKTPPKKHELLGHTAPVKAVATASSHTGDILFTAAAYPDCSIRMWDIAGMGEKEPALLHVFRGHTADVTSLSIVQQGKFLCSGSQDHTVRVWHLHKPRQCVKIFDHVATSAINAMVVFNDNYLCTAESDPLDHQGFYRVQLTEFENPNPHNRVDSPEADVEAQADLDVPMTKKTQETPPEKI